jgi:hypothetical protein
VSYPDKTGMATGTRGVDGLHHRLQGAYGHDRRVRAQAVGQVFDRRHALLTAFGDDVGGSELQRQLLPRFIAAYRDDPFRAERSPGEHPEQPDRAGTDDNDRLARPNLSRDSG